MIQAAINETTNAITAPIHAFIILADPFPPIYPGNANNPGEPYTNLPTPVIPRYNPETPPPIIAAYKGFFNAKLTPYIAGSVIPQTAVSSV